MDTQLTPGVYRARQFIRKFHSTYREIDAAADAGVIERLRHGWYATPGADPAVVAAVRTGGVASCVTALIRHGLWIAPGYDDEIHVRKSKHGELDGIRHCHMFGPVPATPDAVDAIPVALACAARCMTPEHWIAAVDSALNQGKVTMAELDDVWGITPAWVRNMLDRCDGRAQAGTESIVRVRLRALNFHVQVQPYIADVGRVDLLVGRLIIECDSTQHHGSPTLRRNDYRRDRKALIGRWPVIRVDYHDVLHNWPAILADIRAITGTDLHRRRRQTS
ncbi:hypothetical protein HH308_23145 [Gordonia sp. TBRC 11910]|uniref:Very-short-patch-repair endonuclease n=1 Tax=Gordonia asplenii TaxID=2725283 RepID=A0A848L0Y4_9ACTN|nr:hypothetical protein [Gordonia asplenii]NMO04117.1 hypothetical protein [Gordonia asplenii]